ncbi:MAG: DUF922 domain-containing protein [Gilvibacter sp.]
MKIWISICLLGLMAFSAVPEDEKIAWSADYRLTWDDFKGEANYGTSYVASTNSGLSFGYSVKIINGKATSQFTYTVHSYFYPNLSWYVPERVNESILRHEQTHFDISELHARMLRKRIDDFSFTSEVKDELDVLYDQIERERRAMQSTFDFETDHSVLKQPEAQWEQKIATLLKDYDAYQ